MINKCIFQGYVQNEIELKRTPNGIPVATFSLSCPREYKIGDKPQYDYPRLVAWNQIAEFISKKFHKDNIMLVECRLNTRSYDDAGTKKYVTEFVVDKVHFCERPANKQVNEHVEIPDHDDGFTPIDDEDGDIPF